MYVLIRHTFCEMLVKLWAKAVHFCDIFKTLGIAAPNLHKFMLRPAIVTKNTMYYSQLIWHVLIFYLKHYFIFWEFLHIFNDNSCLNGFHRLCVWIIQTIWYVDMPDVPAGYYLNNFFFGNFKYYCMLATLSNFQK